MAMFKLVELARARRKATAFAKQWCVDNPQQPGESLGAYKKRAGEAVQGELAGAGVEIALILEIVKFVMELIAAWKAKKSA